MSAPDYTVRSVGNGRFAVFNAKGVRVSGLYDCKDFALTRAESLARQARRQERPCLTCAKPFMSEGIHNRMCNPCRRDAAGKAYLGDPSMTQGAASGGLPS
ncbi:hypothetical protein [uncultured Maricaulis sp.]|uniref:hypothetical protein n=1 Tax=uncultured Maricaulis sp. TaxID=174710 RepID=UPI0030D75624|tara:strand:- start:146380 stop:146682 length:303 start_codon:yes stop_codon:yes gene_type:complete